MTNQFSQIKWARIVLTVLAVYLLSFLFVFIIVTGYATFLAFQARGAPDQAMIQAFANQYAPWIGPISLIVFTIFGAMRMARRIETAVPLHGILLGALTGVINILFDDFGLVSLAVTALEIAAGWFGTWLGARK